MHTATPTDNFPARLDCPRAGGTIDARRRRLSHRPRALSQSQRGLIALVELSIFLAVIGIILGAMAIGKDLQRNAAYQRLSSDFVQGWLVAYDAYVTATGRVPGDSATAPTGAVNASAASAVATPGTILCDDSAANLLNVFLAAGIGLPEGRSEAQRNRFVYLDANGNPQEARVCFQNVIWAEPDATVGAYVQRPRNVLVLEGLTPSLAQMLDAQIDTQSDPRFGRFRENSQAGAHTTTAGMAWSKTDIWKYSDTSAPAANLNEAQVATVTAYMLMNR